MVKFDWSNSRFIRINKIRLTNIGKKWLYRLGIIRKSAKKSEKIGKIKFINLIIQQIGARWGKKDSRCLNTSCKYYRSLKIKNHGGKSNKIREYIGNFNSL